MSYFRFGDPLDDFAIKEHEEEEWLKRRPVCSCCRQPIQDEKLLYIEGELYHFICAEILFGEYTDEFI